CSLQWTSRSLYKAQRQRELPWDLPGCLIGSDLVPDLKRKELLDINVGLLQIRQNSSWTPRVSPDWLK
ncbi:hypothetical protein IGI04_025940, partial [Brassica rapa subsp. trilocularis]